ncbi:hypothetical protein OAK83_01640 [bacterium]|nr:hypothetical protein [bacterium]
MSFYPSLPNRSLAQDGLTPSQIIKEFEEDEHLYLYARDPEYGELPDEYYGSV